jgi:hypothetical protein
MGMFIKLRRSCLALTVLVFNPSYSVFAGNNIDQTNSKGNIKINLTESASKRSKKINLISTQKQTYTGTSYIDMSSYTFIDSGDDENIPGGYSNYHRCNVFGC